MTVRSALLFPIVKSAFYNGYDAIPVDLTNSVVMLLCCVVVVVVVPLTVVGRTVSDYLRQSRRRNEMWNEWKATYDKEYSSQEDAYRRRVFMRNLNEISRHNARYPVHVSYTRGLNQFSDMTVEEYRTSNRLQSAQNSSGSCSDVHRVSHNQSLPDTVDWRTKGFVTPVKNQGYCTSGWAFSTTGSVEGQNFKKTGHLLSLSEQQLVDCSLAEGNYGCSGGLMNWAFAYIMSVPGGLETEQSYPYTAKEANCSARPSLEKVPVTGCHDVDYYSEPALQQAVALVGPISTSIDSSYETFKSYSGGVYDEPRCSTVFTDHGVLVVGYGTYQGQDYWLVKNSWGTDWGMNGYAMVARNKGNMCGIATNASYPIV